MNLTENDPAIDPANDSISNPTEEFVRLLAKHERDVYGYILSLVLNWADAEEILQETWVRLYQQIDDWDQSKSFRAWACTVAHFQVMTYRKKSRREKLRFNNAFVESVAGQQAVEPPMSAERKSRLGRCLDKLSASKRQLLNLVYSGDLNIQEVAEQVGRTVPATYKSVSRLRKKLQECVEQNMRSPEYE